jgi:hypothetical protein
MPATAPLPRRSQVDVQVVFDTANFSYNVVATYSSVPVYVSGCTNGMVIL